ncbi:hypothetical protein MFLAVUS_009698 [Mucor flavus]|uniref:Uncharacterized protein n=1 Tax=Mucor flavus TaxID=439312 RepID=A0ABP9ZAL8_9FUNG
MEVKQAFEYFGLLEDQFWSTLDERTINHITYEGELKPHDMLLYGEFGFALIGLKPSVLVEFRDPVVNLLYLETVIQPVLFALKEKTLNYHIVKDTKTPESDLNGCIFIYSIVMATNLPELSTVLQATQKFISEDTMATILDYPGHLPRSEREIPTIKTVLYFHNKPNEELIALTSFAIQDSEKEATLSHFKRYFTTCKEKLGIDLKLLIQ